MSLTAKAKSRKKRLILTSIISTIVAILMVAGLYIYNFYLGLPSYVAALIEKETHLGITIGSIHIENGSINARNIDLFTNPEKKSKFAKIQSVNLYYELGKLSLEPEKLFNAISMIVADQVSLDLKASILNDFTKPVAIASSKPQTPLSDTITSILDRLKSYNIKLIINHIAVDSDLGLPWNISEGIIIAKSNGNGPISLTLEGFSSLEAPLFGREDFFIRLVANNVEDSMEKQLEDVLLKGELVFEQLNPKSIALAPVQVLYSLDKSKFSFHNNLDYAGKSSNIRKTAVATTLVEEVLETNSPIVLPQFRGDYELDQNVFQSKIFVEKDYRLSQNALTLAKKKYKIPFIAEHTPEIDLSYEYRNNIDHIELHSNWQSIFDQQDQLSLRLKMQNDRIIINELAYFLPGGHVRVEGQSLNNLNDLDYHLSFSDFPLNRYFKGAHRLSSDLFLSGNYPTRVNIIVIDLLYGRDIFLDMQGFFSNTATKAHLELSSFKNVLFQLACDYNSQYNEADIDFAVQHVEGEFLERLSEQELGIRGMQLSGKVWGKLELEDIKQSTLYTNIFMEKQSPYNVISAFGEIKAEYKPQRLIIKKAFLIDSLINLSGIVDFSKDYLNINFSGTHGTDQVPLAVSGSLLPHEGGFIAQLDAAYMNHSVSTDGYIGFKHGNLWLNTSATYNQTAFNLFGELGFGGGYLQPENLQIVMGDTSVTLDGIVQLERSSIYSDMDVAFDSNKVHIDGLVGIEGNKISPSITVAVNETEYKLNGQLNNDSGSFNGIDLELQLDKDNYVIKGDLNLADLGYNADLSISGKQFDASINGPIRMTNNALAFEQTFIGINDEKLILDGQLGFYKGYYYPRLAVNYNGNDFNINGTVKTESNYYFPNVELSTSDFKTLVSGRIIDSGHHFVIDLLLSEHIFLKGNYFKDSNVILAKAFFDHVNLNNIISSVELPVTVDNYLDIQVKDERIALKGHLILNNLIPISDPYLTTDVKLSYDSSLKDIVSNEEPKKLTVHELNVKYNRKNVFDPIKGEVILSEDSLKADFSGVKGNFNANVDLKWNNDLSASLNITNYPLGYGLQNLRGNITSVLKIDGKLENPNVKGMLSIRNGQFRSNPQDYFLPFNFEVNFIKNINSLMVSHFHLNYMNNSYFIKDFNYSALQIQPTLQAYLENISPKSLFTVTEFSGIHEKISFEGKNLRLITGKYNTNLLKSGIKLYDDTLISFKKLLLYKDENYLNISDFEFLKDPFWKIRATVSGSWLLQKYRLAGSATLNGVRAADKGNFSIDIDTLKYADLEWKLLTANLIMSYADNSAWWEFKENNWGMSGKFHLGLGITDDFELFFNRIIFKDLRYKDDIPRNIAFNGEIDVKNLLYQNLQVKGNISFDLLQYQPIKEIEIAKGDLDLDLTFNQSLIDPLIDGDILIRDGVLFIVDSGFFTGPFQNINGKITFLNSRSGLSGLIPIGKEAFFESFRNNLSGKEAFSDNITFEYSGGTFSGEGIMRYKHYFPVDIFAKIKGLDEKGIYVPLSNSIFEYKGRVEVKNLLIGAKFIPLLFDPEVNVPYPAELTDFYLGGDLLLKDGNFKYKGSEGHSGENAPLPPILKHLKFDDFRLEVGKDVKTNYIVNIKLPFDLGLHVPISMNNLKFKPGGYVTIDGAVNGEPEIKIGGQIEVANGTLEFLDKTFNVDRCALDFDQEGVGIIFKASRWTKDFDGNDLLMFLAYQGTIKDFLLEILEIANDPNWSPQKLGRFLQSQPSLPVKDLLALLNPQIASSLHDSAKIISDILIQNVLDWVKELTGIGFDLRLSTNILGNYLDSNEEGTSKNALDSTKVQLSFPIQILPFDSIDISVNLQDSPFSVVDHLVTQVDLSYNFHLQLSDNASLNFKAGVQNDIRNINPFDSFNAYAEFSIKVNF